MIIKINSRNQITLSKSVREELNIKAGDRLLADMQGRILVLSSQPDSYTKHLQGLHSEIWENIDGEEYINDERRAW